MQNMNENKKAPSFLTLEESSLIFPPSFGEDLSLSTSCLPTWSNIKLGLQATDLFLYVQGVCDWG